MHVLKNVSKSWMTDELLCVKSCARWPDHFVHSGRNSFQELFAAAAVRFLRLPQRTAAGDDLMANRMRVHEVDMITEARRRLAAELRDLPIGWTARSRTIRPCTMPGKCSSNWVTRSRVYAFSISTGIPSRKLG
jgi:hypothetical protein